MAEFMLFAGESYYPRGGARDYLCSVNSVTEAEDELNKLTDNEIYYDGWAHLFEISSNKIVMEWERYMSNKQKDLRGIKWERRVDDSL